MVPDHILGTRDQVGANSSAYLLQWCSHFSVKNLTMEKPWGTGKQRKGPSHFHWNVVDIDGPSHENDKDSGTLGKFFYPQIVNSSGHISPPSEHLSVV